MNLVTKQDILDYLISVEDNHPIHEKGSCFYNIISLSYRHKYERVLAVTDNYFQITNENFDFLTTESLTEWEKQLLKECDFLMGEFGLFFLRKCEAVGKLTSIGF